MARPAWIGAAGNHDGAGKDRKDDEKLQYARHVTSPRGDSHWELQYHVGRSSEIGISDMQKAAIGRLLHDLAPNSVDGIFDRIGSGVHIAADAANRVGAGRQRHDADQSEDWYEADSGHGSVSLVARRCR
jgi:hypothetical protein